MQQYFSRQQKKKDYAIALMVCFICMSAVICGAVALSKDSDDSFPEETVNLVDLNATNKQTEVANRETSKQEVNKQDVKKSEISTFIIQDGEDREVPEVHDYSQDETIPNIEDKVADTAIQPTSEEVVSTEISEETKSREQAVNSQVQNLKFGKDDNLLWPVEGKVLMEFSMDKTIYFKTLDSYKCNPAIMIEAAEGADVKAGAKGYVEETGYDSEIGNYLVLNIGSGYKITYGQLDQVAVGKDTLVEQGIVLAKVAKPTKYYLEEGPNVYMKLTEDDKPVNPIDFLE